MLTADHLLRSGINLFEQMFESDVSTLDDQREMINLGNPLVDNNFSVRVRMACVR
jgi:hypothetical protein